MLDKLIDILVAIWDNLNPFIVINEYEKGVLLRYGIFKKELDKGLHFKIPFADTVLRAIIRTNTFHIATVNVTTLDGKTISVGAMVEYDIFDIHKFLLEFNESESNAHDLTRGIIADYLQDCSWEDCKKKPTLTKIKNKLKDIYADMGMNVTKVLFGDICISRVYTVFKE